MEETASTIVRIDRPHARFSAVVGTGGIGSGRFFALNGNHTLTREESRSGHFLSQHDYCKLHIVSHYLKALAGETLQVYPIGNVGNDDAGKELLALMQKVDLDVRFVRVLDDSPTLYSLSLVYPDGGGGNLTTDDSASARVGVDDVARSSDVLSRYGKRCVAVALPEVPLESRVKLLEMAQSVGAFRIASYTTDELLELAPEEIFRTTDLLVLNVDEARALIGGGAEGPEEVVRTLARAARKTQPAIAVSVTAGKNGSWCDDGSVSFLSSLPVETRNAAGAGDAFLAGVIVGLAAGISLTEAHAIGRLTAAASTTCVDTIHLGLDRRGLSTFALSQPSHGLTQRSAALLGIET